MVTGGTRGIGAAFSRRLIALGHQVIALYRGDDKAAAEAERAGGGHLVALRADLSRPGEVRTAAARVLDRYGPPAVLVNNAGINRDRPFLEMTEQDWDEVLATNLSGPFHLTRALAPAMVRARRGTIVNIAATTANRPRTSGAN